MCGGLGRYVGEAFQMYCLGESGTAFLRRVAPRGWGFSVVETRSGDLHPRRLTHGGPPRRRSSAGEEGSQSLTRPPMSQFALRPIPRRSDRRPEEDAKP